jgi:hypothetical protein
MSRDKDVRTCVKHIIGVAPHDHIHFVQVKPLYVLTHVYESVLSNLYISMKYSV